MTTTPRHIPAERCDELSRVFRLAETLRRMQRRLAGLVADVGQGMGTGHDAYECGN